MDVKQVIVMRKDLNMRKGKMIAQGSHASVGAILSLMRNGISREEYVPEVIDGKYKMELNIDENSPLDQWIRGNFKKICVYVNSERELLDVYEKAKEKGLVNCLIQDDGLTEFHNIPTYTCLAIGPTVSEDIDEITGHLPLL